MKFCQSTKRWIIHYRFHFSFIPRENMIIIFCRNDCSRRFLVFFPQFLQSHPHRSVATVYWNPGLWTIAFCGYIWVETVCCLRFHAELCMSTQHSGHNIRIMVTSLVSPLQTHKSMAAENWWHTARCTGTELQQHGDTSTSNSSQYIMEHGGLFCFGFYQILTSSLS